MIPSTLLQNYRLSDNFRILTRIINCSPILDLCSISVIIATPVSKLQS